MKPQTRAVLAWLQTHDSLSALDALRYLGIYRAGARIYELRQAGYVITATRKGHETAVYHLETA
jgi:hypothetical protein